MSYHPALLSKSTNKLQMIPAAFLFLLRLNRPTPPGCGSPALHLFERMRLARRMLPSELGLPLLRQRGLRGNWRGCVRQLGLIIALLALMWFVRLYLHYCSQWLYLQAIAVPVNKWVCCLWYCHECMIHMHTRRVLNPSTWRADTYTVGQTCTHRQHAHVHKHMHEVWVW